MLKITPLNRRNVRQILRLLARLEETPFRPSLINRWRHGALWLDGFCRMLGLQRWGWPALHAVSEGSNDVLAVSWLVRDSLTLPRWRIEQLVVAPETIDTTLVGTQLIQFLISHYGAQGAQTFVSHVDHQFDQALALLKACGFRQAGRRHRYQVSARQLASLAASAQSATSPDAVPQWQDMGLRHSQDIYELLKRTLPAGLHQALLPSRLDWLAQRLVYRGQTGGWSRAWGLYGRDRSQDIMAYVALRQEETATFHLTLYCHPLMENWLPGLLARCGEQLLKAGADPQVTINIYDHEIALRTLLDQAGAQWLTVSEILEKSYWQRVEPGIDGNPLKRPILLLAGKATPACS